jgi:hypothetical protein
MGWWSATIMGGDEPLDIEGAVYKVCRIEKFSGIEVGKIVQNMIPKEVLKDKMGDILERFKKMEREGYERPILYQVLGTMIMEIGMEIDEELRTTIVDESLKDRWAQLAEDRRIYVDNFVETLRKYDGTPTEIEYEGLMDKMASFFEGEQ